MNNDTAVNGLDIEPFVRVILDPYAQSVSMDEFCAADVNEDGFVTPLDVDAFVLLLLGE